MPLKLVYFLKGAARKTGGYPQLLKNLIAQNDVPHYLTDDGRILLDDAGIQMLCPLVRGHLDRPRLSKPELAASA